MPKRPIGFAAKEETAAVFVRVPVSLAAALDRTAFELKRPKREIVGALLSVLDTEQGRMVLGRADLDFARPAPLEVVTVEQLAELLQVDEETVRELARRGELPGRKLGREWRFSRAAVLDWLACV
jgi:excisionase family DNA binding protein